MTRSIITLTVLFVATCPTSAEPLRILTWNVENGGSSPTKIAEQLAQFRDYHIVGLTEVGRRDFDRYTAAVAGDNRLGWRYIGGLTGGADRLLIICDTERLKLVSYSELFREGDIQIVDDAWRHRAAGLSVPRHRHGDGIPGDAEPFGQNRFRAAAVGAIADAADHRDRRLQFRLQFRHSGGQRGIQRVSEERYLEVDHTDPLIDTNWADHEGDGSDDYPDSMLDFVFVTGAAQNWPVECDVVVRDGDFPDDQTTSDHRPVSCVIDVPSAGGAEAVDVAIRRVLDDQVAAWNAADLDRFMQHYWKSDQLTFSSEGRTQRGWAATMQRYRERYPTPERMGKLRFSELEVQPLGEEAALVLGRWHLSRADGDLEGNFSLVFRMVDGRWQIVHDHTSVLPSQ